MVALLLLLGVLALGVAALRGKTADSRDPEFSLGRVVSWGARRSGSDAPPAGTLPTDPSPRSSVDRAAAF
jgi:hypothetical protein